jgi:probable rRNA maturation factor
MYNVEVNDSQTHIKIDESFIREVVEKTLLIEHVSRATISIALIDNSEIHELNRQYLNHDYETDVLSFLLECEPNKLNNETATDENLSNFPGAGMYLDGEIIVSTEMAAQMATEYHWSPRDELVLYLVHGVLHLVGYDDQCDDDKRRMRTRERAALSHWNLTPHYTEQRQAENQGPGSSVS